VPHRQHGGAPDRVTLGLEDGAPAPDREALGRTGDVGAVDGGGGPFADEDARSSVQDERAAP
jgi:hypothetical protein